LVFGHGAGRDEGAEFVVGERLDHGRLDTRRLDPWERVGLELTAGGEPCGEAANGLLSDAGRAGRAAPASSMPATHWLRAARLIGR
jgi:hypothetical protein